MLRILTQRKNLPVIDQILQEFRVDYTIYQTQGIWRKHTERSLVIETLTEDFDTLKKVAKKIAIRNDQQSVVIQEIKDVLHVYNAEEDVWSSKESALTNMQESATY